MSLSFLSTQVSAPATAPTTDNPGTAFYVRHRRVNIDGQYSLWSDSVQVDLPTIITPETYGDTDQLLRDEVLISSDDTTYYIVTRPNNETGSITISSFDNSWVTTIDEDTQNSVLTNLEFGVFNSSNNPFKDIYIRNTGGNVGSLTFDFINNITGQSAFSYSGLIKVDISGVFTEFSQNPSISYNGSIVWQAPPLDLNTLALILGTNSFVKIRITLVNFPVGGLIEDAINLNLSVQENKTVFPLPFGSDWVLDTLKVIPELGINANFITAKDEGLTVELAPFLINVNGVAVGSFSTTTLTLQSVGDYEITVSPFGVVEIWESGSVPSNLLNIAFITTVNSPTDPLNYIFYYVYLDGQNSFYFENVSNFEGRIVTNNGGVPALANANDEAIGVALGINDYYVSTGYVRVETFDNTVVKGDVLGCGNSGRAVKDNNGFLVAVEDYFQDYVICIIASVGGGGGLTLFEETTETSASFITEVIKLQAIGSDSNAHLCLSPVGFGGFCLDHDNATINRGTFSIDLGLARSALTMVPSGGGSAVLTPYGATASGNQSIGLGRNSIASGFDSVTIGENAQATQQYCLSFGFNSQATSNDAIAFGTQAISSGSGSTALGYFSQSSGTLSVAIGGSNASANRSVAIGVQAECEGGSSVALGDFARVLTTNASNAVSFVGSVANSYKPFCLIGGHSQDRNGTLCFGNDWDVGTNSQSFLVDHIWADSTPTGATSLKLDFTGFNDTNNDYLFIEDGEKLILKSLVQIENNLGESMAVELTQYWSRSGSTIAALGALIATTIYQSAGATGWNIQYNFDPTGLYIYIEVTGITDAEQYLANATIMCNEMNITNN